MRTKALLFFAVAGILLGYLFTGCTDRAKDIDQKSVPGIVASDTILSGMLAALLPPSRYSVEAILPPGQCPGHYDTKFTDIEKMKDAALYVRFRGMSFMGKTGLDDRHQLLVDAGGRNWMSPKSYIHGIELLADELSKRFPEDRTQIMERKEHAVREVRSKANRLLQKIRESGVFGKPVIGSSMQKEPLEWMGFRVAGEYGRQEAMSAGMVVKLTRIGKDRKAIMVVDNLQSGPDTGRGIAETLGVPHVVLTNFPSEKGYLATLGENVNAVLSAVRKKAAADHD